MKVRFVPWLLLILGVAACTRGDDVRAVGQLAWDRVELVAEAPEPVVSIIVHEGERVAAGALLIQLDATRASAQLKQAAAARRQTEARLAEIERGTRDERVSAARAELSGTEAAFDSAQRDFARIEALAEQQLVSPGTLDRSRADRDSALARRDAARARLDELVHGATREELRQAQAALMQAEAAESAAAVTVERLSVRAPQPGRIDALPFEVGERPAAGAVVAVMLVGDAPYARVYVPEPLRARISPGSTARVFVDGVAQPFTGKVRRVSSEAAFTPYFALTRHDRARLSYLAEVVLEGSSTGLAAGIPVEVSFATTP